MFVDACLHKVCCDPTLPSFSSMVQQQQQQQSRAFARLPRFVSPG